MPILETDERLHDTPEVPGHIRDDIESYTRTELADRTAARALQAIFQRNGTDKKRTEQSLGVYDLVGQTTSAAQAEYATDLERQIRNSVERQTFTMTLEERQRVAMILPSLVGALILDEKYVDKAYARSLPDTVDIALDWFKNPDIIDQTHIRVGFGGEEVSNSRAPAYIVPALETQRRVRETFTRYGNWAIHQEMVNRIQEETSNNSEDQREAINRLNATIAQQLAEYGPDQDAKNQSELMEEIYNMTAKHEIPAQHKRDILLTTWQDIFGEPLDVKALENKYHFTNKVPTLVVFNAAHAAVEVDGMDYDRVTGARDTTQTLLREFVTAFYPEMADSLEFQNDRHWDNHNYYTQMMVMYSRYLTSRRSNIGSVWKNLDRFGDHHQRGGKKARVIDGMSPSETYGSLHPFFFQDPLEIDNPAELLPDPHIMEPVEPPRHVIFHQGPPEIQFGALRKVWAQDASAKAFVKWLSERRDSANDLQSNAQTILDDFRVAATDDFSIHARKKVNDAPKKIRSLLISMIQAVEHDPDPLAAWEQQIADIRMFDPQYSTPLIDHINARRSTLGIRNDAIHIAVARNDRLLGQLVSDEVGQEIVQKTRSTVELTVSVGTIPVYYPLKGVDKEVDTQTPNPTLAQYEEYLTETVAKSKRIRGSIEYTNKNFVSEYQSMGEEQDPQVTELQQALQPAIVEMYAQIDIDEQAIVNEGRKPTQAELEQMAAFISSRVETIKAEVASTQPHIPDTASVVAQIFHQTHSALLRDRAVAESKAQAVLHDFRLLLRAIDPDPQIAEQKYGQLLDRIKHGMAVQDQGHVVAYL